MSSFVARFKKDSDSQTGENSKQHGIMLESMRNADNDLANQVSEVNSINDPLAAAFVAGKESVAPNDKSQDELALEQQIDGIDLHDLLEAIKNASSPEELQELMAQYEALVSDLDEKKSILRSHSHIKKLLEIQAALAILQELSKNPALRGKKLAEMLKSQLQSMQGKISRQATQMLAQNMLLANLQKSVNAMLEAIKANPELATPELMQMLEKMQAQLTDMQQGKISGKEMTSLLDSIKNQIVDRLSNLNPDIVAKLAEVIVQNAITQHQAVQKPNLEVVANLQALQSNITNMIASGQIQQALISALPAVVQTPIGIGTQQVAANIAAIQNPAVLNNVIQQKAENANIIAQQTQADVIAGQQQVAANQPPVELLKEVNVVAAAQYQQEVISNQKAVDSAPEQTNVSKTVSDLQNSDAAKSFAAKIQQQQAEQVKQAGVAVCVC